MCLHGFSGSGADFEPIAQSFLCIAPDLTGHGRSPKPTEPQAYRCAEQFEAIRHTVHAQRLQRPILLGYSMGGRLALQLACARHAAFSALVLIGATPGLRGEAERLARREADETLASDIEKKGIAWFAEHWSQTPIIASQQSIMDPWKTKMQRRRQENSPHALAMSLRHAGVGVMKPVWDKLHTLHLPTLLITGCDDTKFTAIASEMASLLPHTRHIALDGAGHCAHLENISGFHAALQQFCADL